MSYKHRYLKLDVHPFINDHLFDNNVGQKKTYTFKYILLKNMKQYEKPQ